MATNKTTGPAPGTSRRDFWMMLGFLVLIFGVLFHRSFMPGEVIFNNDGPVGVDMRAASELPSGFAGQWIDLNWLGVENLMSAPDPTNIFMWLAGPMNYSKFWTPLSLIILGLCAWLFFRTAKFAPFVCVLGGLAAALHGDFFSNVCWGQASRPMSLAAMFLALAALQNGSGIRSWIRTLLAGAAVGMGILEGFDIAALFSLIIGAYVVYQAWAAGEGPAVKRLARGVGRLALVAGFAAFLAAQQLSALINTQIKGVAGTEQDAQTKQEKWGWATQWSLPKIETLSSFVPGLFGYRPETPMGLPEDMQQSYMGGQYWGACGRDLAWDRYYASLKTDQPLPRPTGALQRFGGGGIYGGQLVFWLALLAILQSFRKQNSPFDLVTRRFVWFWTGIAVVCLLLTWGRFAPFYQFFYMLPYASTIRNPAKFIDLFDWAMVVLFAYGAQSLVGYLHPAKVGTGRMAATASVGWGKLPAFEKRWILGSVAGVILVLVGWAVYAHYSPQLQAYLQEVGFDAGLAAVTASFSIRQVGWFLLFLTLALGAVALIITGNFSGEKAKYGAITLGLILVVDLARADLPWIIYWDYPVKYATNPILERLREKPYEQRVIGFPQWVLHSFSLSPQVKSAEQNLDTLYGQEWAQHHFQRYNIQSLDVVQMPRQPEDFVAFESALQFRSGSTLYLQARKWELTNTRYILGLAGFADFLNQQLDPVKQRFRVAETFNLGMRSPGQQFSSWQDITAKPDTNGIYGLIEFTGALPRAKLYAQWETNSPAELSGFSTNGLDALDLKTLASVGTNDFVTLQKLAARDFDPHQKVLVADAVPAPVAGTNQDAGTVEFTSYAPKDVVLKAQATTPAVLLLNDRYAPNWSVRVDGQPATMLRCNYLMRGVYLQPGTHKVEFIFQPSMKPMYISLTAIALAAGLLLVLGVTARQRATKASAEAEKPKRAK
ncbi:MAG TPA: hypothetical protein VL527_10980 [Dongiaceae bacterium]|nr:hypothetical protein [Dongiaceae bacterium]